MSAQEGISTFKPATVAMAAEFRKKIKVNKEGVVEAPEDLYESTLENAGLDMSTVNKVQKHNTEVVSALTLAVGEVGLEALKKHDKLDQITGEFKAGRDEIGIVMSRTREVNDMKNPGEKITQYGPTVIKYTVKGTSNSGELKKVRQHLMAQAKQILEK